MGYFIFKDIDSRNIPGLIVQSLPPITKPEMRVERIEIDGNDGDIEIEQGYKAYDKIIEIGLTRGYDIDEIINWLKGSGNLVMSTEPDKYYKASIRSRIDFERLLCFRTADVVFHVQPYKYAAYEASIQATSEQLTAKSVTIGNIGNEPAEPLLHLIGSGTVTVSMNGSSVFSYTFPNGETEVYIDSEEQDAYLDTILKNRNMNGAFVELPPGASTITWTGTLTALEITPRSRWV